MATRRPILAGCCCCSRVCHRASSPAFMRAAFMRHWVHLRMCWAWRHEVHFAPRGTGQVGAHCPHAVGANDVYCSPLGHSCPEHSSVASCEWQVPEKLGLWGCSTSLANLPQDKWLFASTAVDMADTDYGCAGLPAAGRKTRFLAHSSIRKCKFPNRY